MAVHSANVGLVHGCSFSERTGVVLSFAERLIKFGLRMLDAKGVTSRRTFLTNTGRTAAHTGQVVTYDEILNCKHEFAPDIDKLTVDSPAPGATRTIHYRLVSAPITSTIFCITSGSGMGSLTYAWPVFSSRATKFEGRAKPAGD